MKTKGPLLRHAPVGIALLAGGCLSLDGCFGLKADQGDDAGKTPETEAGQPGNADATPPRDGTIEDASPPDAQHDEGPADGDASGDADAETSFDGDAHGESGADDASDAKIGEGGEEEVESGNDADGAPTPLAFDDGTTQCTVGGISMHCCPPSSVMVGVRMDQGVYKCAWLPPNASSGQVLLDPNTMCNGMHCCPSSTLMVGLRNDINTLACLTVPGLSGAETVDGNPPTVDGFPMHVCPGWTGDGPSPFAMGGIQVNLNLLDCRR